MVVLGSGGIDEIFMELRRREGRKEGRIEREVAKGERRKSERQRKDRMEKNKEGCFRRDGVCSTTTTKREENGNNTDEGRSLRYKF